MTNLPPKLKTAGVKAAFEAKKETLINLKNQSRP